MAKQWDWRRAYVDRMGLTPKEKTAARRLAKARREKAERLLQEAGLLLQMTTNTWPPAPCHDPERSRA